MRSSVVVLTASLALFALAPAAPAQEVGPEVSPSVPEKVIVTGSGIKRIAGETALPMQIITRDDIQRTGMTTTTELLNAISAATSAGNTNPASAMYSGNEMTGASLRGLGYQRTLILLNGRRVANNALDGGGVDLETIPLSAIERVEVLEDGASAIYGADAIGGVINFILKSNYQGVEVGLYSGETQRGGGDGQHIHLSAGAGDLASDRYNFFITAEASDDAALHANQRPYTDTTLLPPIYGPGRYSNLSTFPFPGNAYTSYGPGAMNFAIANIGSPYCTAPHLYPSPGGEGGCLYDYGFWGDVIPVEQKFSAVSRISYRLENDSELFIESSFSRNRYTLVTSPTYAQGESSTAEGSFPGQVPFVILPTSPYYPRAFAEQYGVNGQPISFVSRLSELGPGVTVTANDQARIVLGADGSLDGWDYNSALNLNRADSSEYFMKGIVDTDAFYQLALSGAYNPFGPQSPAGLAALKSTQWSGQTRAAVSDIEALDLKLSRDLVQLPAGPLALAIGAEAREESLYQQYSSHYENGWLLDYGGAGAPADPPSRTVRSLSAEIDVPIMTRLDLDLSVRDDDYSSFGNTANPKASLKWQPIEQLLLRGSYGTGFRAPNLVDLGTPRSIMAGYPFSDPVRCPNGIPVAGANPSYDCNDSFLNAKYGNPNLQPEKSRQGTLGFVYEPTKQLSVGVNYFHIDLTNVIQINGLPESLAFNPATASQYSYLLVRGPINPLFPNLPGEILYVNTPSINQGEWDLAGEDLDASYRWPSSCGNFTVKINGTYFQTFNVSQIDGPMIGTVGQKNQQGDGVVNRWHHYLSLDWERGPWDTTLAQTFWSGYRDENSYASLGSPLPGYPRVSSYALYDLTTQYKWSKQLTVSTGIRNLLDTSPPFTNNYEGDNFDPSYADLRGRMFWISATYSFL